MPVANITVAYVNQPKPGKKMGSIKAESGEFYSVWPDKLANFSPGMMATIEYTEESFQGRPYRTFKRMIGPAGTGPAPKANGAATGSPSYTKSTEMAVMGIIGRAYQGTGGVESEDVLYNQMLAVRAAWERCFATDLGPKPAKTTDMPADFDVGDEIPF